MQSTICETLDWKKHKLELSLPGEISITSDMQMTPPYVRKWRGTKKPLDESESGEWKSWLKVQVSENEDHGIWSHHFMANRWENNGSSERLLFLWAPKSLQMVIAAVKLKDPSSLEETETDQSRQHIKKQRHYFTNKGPSSQSYGFSSHHVWMWELDYKESWAPKNWCFWTVVL